MRNPIQEEPPNIADVIEFINERQIFEFEDGIRGRNKARRFAKQFIELIARLYSVWPTEMADHVYLLRASLGCPGGNILVYQQCRLLWNGGTAAENGEMNAAAYIHNIPGYELDMFKELGWIPEIDFDGKESITWYAPPAWVFDIKE